MVWWVGGVDAEVPVKIMVGWDQLASPLSCRE